MSGISSPCELVGISAVWECGFRTVDIGLYACSYLQPVLRLRLRCGGYLAKLGWTGGVDVLNTIAVRLLVGMQGGIRVLV